MDKIDHYRKIILQILEKYEHIVPFNLPDAENQLICDLTRDRYLLMRVGFEDNRRVHYSVFHFDILNGKIWIQEDTTDIPVVQLFLDAGIPKEDIVLAFHAPFRRELSGFAVS
jgi:XisI protein